MPSRQDQLHSYQFSVQRVVAALVMRDTDPAQSPFRRVAGATMAGAVFATLALAGAAVIGLRAGGPGDWRTEGKVIIEKESGARYVYYKGDGKLHPVLNYASALLIAGGDHPDVEMVSRSALASAQRGTPMGIPGAPDSLPDPKGLLRAPWTLCSPAGGADAADPAAPRSLLVLGSAAKGGRALVPTGAANAADGMLLSTPDGRRYLVYDNKRYRLVEPDTVLRAFAWSTTRTLQVSPAVVNALPAGPDMRLLSIPGRGGRSPAVPGAKIGQVYSFMVSGVTQHAVVLADGLADITEAQAALLAVDPDTPPGPNPDGSSLKPPDYQSATRSKAGLTQAPPFATRPEIREATNSVCVSVHGEKGADEVRLDASLPDSIAPTATAARTARGALLADLVSVPPGRGALVEAVAAPGDPSGALSIVTDLGVRYPLASRDLAAKLGYRGVSPLRMPAEIVSLLPSGPALDPAAAQQGTGS
jgi:type VII secretion protein EccB